jgi:predicted RNA polymerase sigma factor
VNPAAPPSAVAAHAELQALLATQRRRVVAHLARSLGLPHLALAEDAVQAAALRALEDWPARGVPANPAGWLYRVARHAAIDACAVAAAKMAGRKTTKPGRRLTAQPIHPRGPLCR